MNIHRWRDVVQWWQDKTRTSLAHLLINRHNKYVHLIKSRNDRNYQPEQSLISDQEPVSRDSNRVWFKAPNRIFRFLFYILLTKMSDWIIRINVYDSSTGHVESDNNHHLILFNFVLWHRRLPSLCWFIGFMSSSHHCAGITSVVDFYLGGLQYI